MSHPLTHFHGSGWGVSAAAVPGRSRVIRSPNPTINAPGPEEIIRHIRKWLGESTTDGSPLFDAVSGLAGEIWRLRNARRWEEHVGDAFQHDTGLSALDAALVEPATLPGAGPHDVDEIEETLSMSWARPYVDEPPTWADAVRWFLPILASGGVPRSLK